MDVYTVYDIVVVVVVVVCVVACQRYVLGRGENNSKKSDKDLNIVRFSKDLCDF